jgi:ribosomal protein L24
MIKTKICKGDKVIFIRGAASEAIDPDTKKPLVCTVMKVDRVHGTVLIEMPRVKEKKKKDRETPRKGVEQWKTARYNPKTGEAGGLKIMKKPVSVSNLRIVEAAPKKEYGVKA